MLWHLQERVYFAHCRNKVWDERFYFGIELNFLRLESTDVLEKFLHFARYGQVSVGKWIVSARGEFFVSFSLLVTILIFVLLLQCAWALMLLVLLLLLGGELLLAGKIRCKLLLVVHLYLVFFFFRVNFFAVVHIDRQVVMLVVDWSGLH